MQQEIVLPKSKEEALALAVEIQKQMDELEYGDGLGIIRRESEEEKKYHSLQSQQNILMNQFDISFREVLDEYNDTEERKKWYEIFDALNEFYQSADYNGELVAVIKSGIETNERHKTELRRIIWDYVARDNSIVNGHSTGERDWKVKNLPNLFRLIKEVYGEEEHNLKIQSFCKSFLHNRVGVTGLISLTLDELLEDLSSYNPNLRKTVEDELSQLYDTEKNQRGI